MKYMVNLKLYQPFSPCMVFHANFGVLMILKCQNVMLSVASSIQNPHSYTIQQNVRKLGLITFDAELVQMCLNDWMKPSG